MSCPFPGMDPYLEAQGVWPDFHARVITYITPGRRGDIEMDRGPE